MRLTRAGEYAVRCVLFLATRGRGVLCARKEIAAAMGIPDPFLGKIAQQLSRAGLIEIVQGARGGFRLTRSPEEVTLLSVVEAVIGEIFLNDCLMRPDSCNRSDTCAVHHIWDRARSQLRQTLTEATFAGILADQSCIAPFMPNPRPEGRPPRAINPQGKGVW
jgi:Rrf2 family protein